METFHIALFKFSFLVIVAIESIMMYINFYILPLLFIKYVTSIECLVSLLSENLHENEAERFRNNMTKHISNLFNNKKKRNSNLYDIECHHQICIKYSTK